VDIASFVGIVPDFVNVDKAVLTAS
jgi:hypothetical protein